MSENNSTSGEIIMQSPPAENTKAYRVRGSESVCVLVWATTRAKAKYIANACWWLDHEDYCQMRAYREPTLDGRRQEGCCVGGDKPLSVDEARMMRTLGWWEAEGSERTCNSCGLYQWHDIVESRIGDDGQCGECKGKNKEKTDG